MEKPEKDIDLAVVYCPKYDCIDRYKICYFECGEWLLPIDDGDFIVTEYVERWMEIPK